MLFQIGYWLQGCSVAALVFFTVFPKWIEKNTNQINNRGKKSLYTILFVTACEGGGRMANTDHIQTQYQSQSRIPIRMYII